MIVLNESLDVFAAIKTVDLSELREVLSSLNNDDVPVLLGVVAVTHELY